MEIPTDLLQSDKAENQSKNGENSLLCPRGQDWPDQNPFLTGQATPSAAPAECSDAHAPASLPTAARRGNLPLKTCALPLRLASVDRERKCISYIVTSSAIDRYGEIVDPRGIDFANFRASRRTVFWNHDYNMVVGRSIEERLEGESVVATIEFAAEETPFADEIWRLCSGGYVGMASIGFLPKRYEDIPLGELRDLAPPNRNAFPPTKVIRIWRASELLEISLVGIGANPAAVEYHPAHRTVISSHSILKGVAMQQEQKHEQDQPAAALNTEGKKPREVVQLEMNELQALFTNALAEANRKAGLDRVDRKHGIYPTSALEDRDGSTKDERFRAWLRRTFLDEHGHLSRTKALLEGTGSAGGFLVPEEFRTEVLRVAEKYGVARREAFVFPINSDSMSLNTAAGTVSVNWFSENQVITPSDPIFAQPQLVVRKAAGITALSNELFADAKFPLINYLAELFGEALSGAEDEQAFTGTGSVFTGMLNVSGIQNRTGGGPSMQDFTPDDLLTLIMAVESKYRPGAKFYMHPVVFSVFRRAKDNGGGYLVQTPGDPRQPFTIWGYPVVEVERMPASDQPDTAYVSFGNMRRHCYFADRQQMQVAIGTEGTVGSSNLFERDMNAVRVTERIGLLWVFGAGLARLKTGGEE